MLVRVVHEVLVHVLAKGGGGGCNGFGKFETAEPGIDREALVVCRGLQSEGAVGERMELGQGVEILKLNGVVVIGGGGIVRDGEQVNGGRGIVVGIKQVIGG